MDRKTIVIVDDERDIIELVCENLELAGFHSKGFQNANDLFSFLKTQIPHLLLLDLMLPDMDGLEICKRLKAEPDSAGLPIIMLTARDAELDKILGLELGADDYVTKPFSPRELVSRIKAVLRRAEPGCDETASKRVVISDSLYLDLSRYKTYLNGAEVKLTVTEFKILSILAENRGWVYSREQILERLWGGDRYSVDRTVDVHIRHLREKLGDQGKLIENVRGVGYKLTE